MPQAPGSLSPAQKATLESVYTFLKCATVYLRAAVVYPEDEAQVKAVLDLGELALSRLPEYFPEVRWLVGGGVQ